MYVYVYVGGFSYFQIWAMIVIISPEIMASMISMSPILTSSRDVIFLCDNDDNNNDTGISFNISAKHIKTDNDICNGTLIPLEGSYISVVQEVLYFCTFIKNF